MSISAKNLAKFILGLYFLLSINFSTAEDPNNDSQPPTNTPLALALIDPNSACQEMLLVVQKLPERQNTDSIKNERGQLNIERILTLHKIKPDSVEQLSKEIHSLIYESLFFKSKLISHFLYLSLRKRSIYDYKQSADYVSRFYLLSENEKKEITEEILFRIMCVLERFDSTRGTYNPIEVAKLFGLDHESFLSLLKYWHTYASSDPGLYRLQLAMTFVFQYSAETILKDFKSFFRWFTPYGKTTFTFYGAPASLLLKPLSKEERAFSSTIDLLNTEKFKAPNLYRDGYDRDTSGDNILGHPHLYFLEFYLHRNIYFLNLKSLKIIKEKYFEKLKSESKILLEKHIQELEAIQKPVTEALAKVKEHSDQVALHSNQIEKLEDRKKELVKSRTLLQNEIEVFRGQGQNPLLRAISQYIRSKGARFSADNPEAFSDLKAIFHTNLERSTPRDFVKTIEYLFPYIVLEKGADARSWAGSWILWIRALARFYTFTSTDKFYLFDNLQSKFFLNSNVSTDDISYLKTFLDDNSWGQETPIKTKASSKKTAAGIKKTKSAPQVKGESKESPELKELSDELSKVNSELQDIETKLIESRKFLKDSSTKEAELSKEAEALKSRLLHSN
ncbi:MAG: hypothetical protein KA116_10335 [Proteobacteria bacterium]|nr:hypothetical protein [Pseudomonadota bacterium]